MARILKNADRETIKRLVLEESFAPRFEALRQRMVELLKEEVARQHPVFMRLIGDKETRPYVSCRHQHPFVHMHLNSRTVFWEPVFGRCARLSDALQHWRPDNTNTLVGAILFQLTQGDAVFERDACITQARNAYIKAKGGAA